LEAAVPEAINFISRYLICCLENTMLMFRVVSVSDYALKTYLRQNSGICPRSTGVSNGDHGSSRLLTLPADSQFTFTPRHFLIYA
jgi:hypothetical protein